MSANYIDEVELEVVPLDVCNVVFGNPYMYKRDVIFMRRENKHRLIKHGKSFIFNTYTIYTQYGWHWFGRDYTYEALWNELRPLSRRVPLR